MLCTNYLPILLLLSKIHGIQIGQIKDNYRLQILWIQLAFLVKLCVNSKSIVCKLFLLILHKNVPKVTSITPNSSENILSISRIFSSQAAGIAGDTVRL